MDHSIENLCAHLSLTEQEEEVIVVEENSLGDALVRAERCLLFKLLTIKHFNKEALKSTMKKIWRPVKAITVRDLNPTLFIAEFEDMKDKDRVKRDGPWLFDKQLVLASDVERLKQTHQVHYQRLCSGFISMIFQSWFVTLLWGDALARL